MRDFGLHTPEKTTLYRYILQQGQEREVVLE